MDIRTGLTFVILLVAMAASLSNGKTILTMLEIDNAPCKPENLKKTNRYICDSYGNVTCQHGWTESSPPDRQNPCLIPVCEAGCDHGECRGPDLCACEIGWEGNDCSQCIRLPGCEHGTCDEALTCICEEGWTGAFCNEPECDACENGLCSGPGVCSCHIGWFGDDCDQCEALPGCQHGRCEEHPNTCVCDDGWEGALCDIPKCEPACARGRGECIEGADGKNHHCLCFNGWQGNDCNQCRAYWNCPNKDVSSNCHLPNQCLCPSTFGGQDPENICNSDILGTKEDGKMMNRAD